MDKLVRAGTQGQTDFNRAAVAEFQHFCCVGICLSGLLQSFWQIVIGEFYFFREDFLDFVAPVGGKSNRVVIFEKGCVKPKDCNLCGESMLAALED